MYSEARLRTLGRTSWPCSCKGAQCRSPATAAIHRPGRSGPSPVAKVVLLILLALLDRLLGHHPLQALAASAASSGRRRSFLDVFRRSSKFSEVQAVCRSLRRRARSSGMFQAGYAELTAQLRQAPDADASNPDAAAPHVQL